MPLCQGPALSQRSVRTGVRQPMVIVYGIWCQHCTARYFCQPFGVHRATTGVFIHKTTNQVGVIDLSGVFIFKFVQTALSAAIAQRFPLLSSHLIETLALPEWNLSNHLSRRSKVLRNSTTYPACSSGICRRKPFSSNASRT